MGVWGDNNLNLIKPKEIIKEEKEEKFEEFSMKLTECFSKDEIYLQFINKEII